MNIVRWMTDRNLTNKKEATISDIIEMLFEAQKEGTYNECSDILLSQFHDNIDWHKANRLRQILKKLHKKRETEQELDMIYLSKNEVARVYYRMLTELPIFTQNIDKKKLYRNKKKWENAKQQMLECYYLAGKSVEAKKLEDEKYPEPLTQSKAKKLIKTTMIKILQKRHNFSHSKAERVTIEMMYEVEDIVNNQ